MAGKIGHVEWPAQDVERATAFYGSLFGWEFQDAGMHGMQYMLFQAEPPGAVYPSQREEKGPNVYFVSEEIDADVAKVRELGGQADDKQQIPGIGWFSRCEDTEGNPFSLFQGDHSAQAPGQ
jgi:predicted enzyme related to lactoylglutathione lyase